MKVKVYVKETSGGELPVFLHVTADDGKRFMLSTGLTSGRKFSGVDFPKSEKCHEVKTRVLTKQISDVMEFGITHRGLPASQLKEQLLPLVGNNAHRGAKRLHERMRDFASMKEKESTRKVYLLTADKVERYDAAACFDDVDLRWLQGFERMCRDTMGVNSTSIQMRNVRAVFNWAIDNGWTECYPFRRFKIRQERVAIRNVSTQMLVTIRDWAVEPWQEIYRDLFMLSFYLCGVNAGDLLLCRGLTNGRFVYRRRKTGKVLDLPVCDEAKRIIEKWKGKDYLLCPMDSHKSYLDFLHHWNDALGKIGSSETIPDVLGRKRKVVYHPLVEGLTTYAARYTFASVCAEIDIPREVTALCLGHSWADVTSRYVAYERKKIDDAVGRVVDYLREVGG